MEIVRLLKYKEVVCYSKNNYTILDSVIMLTNYHWVKLVLSKYVYQTTTPNISKKTLQNLKDFNFVREK